MTAPAGPSPAGVAGAGSSGAVPARGSRGCSHRTANTPAAVATICGSRSSWANDGAVHAAAPASSPSATTTASAGQAARRAASPASAATPASSDADPDEQHRLVRGAERRGRELDQRQRGEPDHGGGDRQRRRGGGGDERGGEVPGSDGEGHRCDAQPRRGPARDPVSPRGCSESGVGCAGRTESRFRYIRGGRAGGRRAGVGRVCGHGAGGVSGRSRRAPCGSAAPRPSRSRARGRRCRSPGRGRRTRRAGPDRRRRRRPARLFPSSPQMRATSASAFSHAGHPARV